LKHTGSDLLVASAGAELELELELLVAGAVVEELEEAGGAEEGVCGVAGASWPWTMGVVARRAAANVAARNPGNPSKSFIVRFTLICQRRVL
jgi:hypothetical protein